MEGFAKATDLLGRMQREAGQYRDALEKMHDGDGAAIHKVQAILDEAATTVHDENARINGLISELKQEFVLQEQLLIQLNNSSISEEEIENLHRELAQTRQLEADLEAETIALKEEVNEIEEGLRAVESKKEELKKLESLQQKNHNELSLYAQISRIIPDIQVGGSKIAGSLMDRQRRLSEEFQKELSQSSEYEICHSLWHIQV